MARGVSGGAGSRRTVEKWSRWSIHQQYTLQHTSSVQFILYYSHSTLEISALIVQTIHLRCSVRQLCQNANPTGSRLEFKGIRYPTQQALGN